MPQQQARYKTRRHIQPVWLFDLDNTLHDASRHAFPTIDAAMTRFIAEALQVETHTASHLRVHYWQRYGATILGLMRHHSHIDPQHFLAQSHPLSTLLREVYPARGLKRTLARLPGRKIVFTNGPHAYAVAMLAALGINQQIDSVFAIDHAGYTPKPQMRAYRQVLRHYRLRARRCIMVEDTLANLQPAKRLGMRTVWLRRNNRSSAWADQTIKQLAALAPHRL